MTATPASQPNGPRRAPRHRPHTSPRQHNSKLEEQLRAQELLPHLAFGVVAVFCDAGRSHSYSL